MGSRPGGGRPPGRRGGGGTGPRGPVRTGGTGRGTPHKSSFAAPEMIKVAYGIALIPLAAVLYVAGYFITYYAS